MQKSKNQIESALYLVTTPIGNLEDFTPRAIKVLSEVDIIACEDTRNSGNLLKLMNINYKKLVSYHDYNENEQSLYLIEQIKNGLSVALISDAGMPSISDPGFRLVQIAVNEGIRVIPIPGASAFSLALIGSGFPVHKFAFFGFPPHKKGRKTFIEETSLFNGTIILYEAQTRVEKLLNQIKERFGDEIEICIARELTKLHEEFLRGTPDELNKEIQKRGGLKGEIVVLINNNK